MNTHRTIAWTMTVAVSAAAGWVVRGAPDPAVAPATWAAACHVPERRALTPAVERTLIAVSDDGRATLHVDQQPLEWVLEQIALQAGRAPLARSSAATASAVVAAAPAEAEAAEPTTCPAPYLPADPARLLHTIEHGADDERVDAMQRARADGLPVPEVLLRTLVATAASDQVRVAALEHWLELRAGDPKAERAVLEAALLVPSAVVQQEARQRLDDLTETERLDALAEQGSP